MAANSAARLILRELLQTIRASEEGIKADTDIEFLHEYRVAVRRTRSALSQIRRVFPPEQIRYYRQEFGNLGRRTNELRTLDVFLSMELDYRGRLPVDLSDDISPLFELLNLRRSEALAKVVAELESESYGRFMNEWERFVHQPIGQNHPRNAREPIIKLARKRIRRQYQAILERGALTLHHPDDDLLHALRIECKKLRYLLEFFAELFRPEETIPPLKQLKRLQENLGAVSDLGDQRDYLYSIAEVLDMERAQTRRTLLAIGILIETVDREQQAMRADFAKSFKRFSAPRHQQQFQNMLK